MRRTTKKSSVVGAIAAAATVAALSAGTINVYAQHPNAEWFRVGTQGADIAISTLHNAGNEAHVQSIINAFHNAEPLFVSSVANPADASDWDEMSAEATAADFFTDADTVPEWAPYF